MDNSSSSSSDDCSKEKEEKKNSDSDSDSTDTKSADEALRREIFLSRKRQQQKEGDDDEPPPKKLVKKKSAKKQQQQQFDSKIVNRITNDAIVMLGFNTTRQNNQYTTTPYNDIATIEYAEAVLLRLCNPLHKLEPENMTFKEALQTISANQWKPEMQHLLRHHLGKFQNTIGNVFCINRKLKKELYMISDEALAFTHKPGYKSINELNDINFTLFMSEIRSMLNNSNNHNCITPSTLISSSVISIGSSSNNVNNVYAPKRFKLHK